MLLVSSVAPSASWGVILLQIIVQKCCRHGELPYVAYLSNLYQKDLRLTESVFASVLLFYFIVWERKSFAACFCFCEVWCAINGVERNRLGAVLRTRCLTVFYFYIHALSVFVHPPTGSLGSNLTYKHPLQFWSQGWQGYWTELLVQAVLEDEQPIEQQQGEINSIFPFLNSFCCSFTRSQSIASLCRWPLHHPSVDNSSGISSPSSHLSGTMCLKTLIEKP